MRTSSILSILNAGNSYASLRSLSVTLEHEVCQALGCLSLNLIAWDEVWKLYADGRWSCILPMTDETCSCDQSTQDQFGEYGGEAANDDNTPALSAASGGKRASCCFLNQVYRELKHWKFVFFRPSRLKEICKILHVKETQASRVTAATGHKATSKHGEYLLVVKLAPTKLDRFQPNEKNLKSGLLIARIFDTIDPTIPAVVLANKAQAISKRLIESVSTAYHTSLNAERMAKHLAENTFILTLTRITSHLTHTRVVDVFSRIDAALKNFRYLRLSAILAVDDVNRELVQVWHNKDKNCMECKPISTDCDSIKRCLHHGEAQIVSLSQVRSMNRMTPRKHRRRLFGDSSERNQTHRQGPPTSALLIPPLNSDCVTTAASYGGLDDLTPPPPPSSPSLSPAFLSKVHGCTLKTANEKQGCRLLAPLVGPNGTAKVVMVIDRKYSVSSPGGEDLNLGSTTDYDTFMSPSLFRVLQEMVRTLGTTALHSVISDYVMTTLITQNQKRRESAPSHCIIEYVYGVIPTQREDQQPQPQPPQLNSLDGVGVTEALADVAEHDTESTPSVVPNRRTRRASAPIFCASQTLECVASSSLSNDTPGTTFNLHQWNAPCIDYFSMTNDQFFEFFDYSLTDYAHVVLASGGGYYNGDRRSERIRRRGFFDFVMNAYLEANPYHNKYHAVQVLHVSWHMIGMMSETLLRKGDKTIRHAHSTDLPLASSFSNEERFVSRPAPNASAPNPISVSPVFDELAYALLLASILHDIDHIGVTNNYLVAISHPLSILYNDHAVLEQHHCAFIFAAFNQRKQIDLTRQSRTLRKLMIEMILATDMAKHTQLISSLTQLSANTCLEALTDEEWAKLGQILLHASDLSNQTTEFPYFVRWAGLCIEEFNRQVNMEIENGLPITSYMNCRTDSSRIEMELGFLEFVVLPLWQPLAILEPKMAQWLETGASNSQFWRDCLKELNGETSPTRPEDSSDDLIIADALSPEDTFTEPQNLASRDFINLWRQTGKSLFELEAERR